MESKTLESQIKQLKDDLLTLGYMVEAANVTATTALMENDQETSRALINNDALINGMRFVLESGVINALSTQQPSAHDLRVLTSILDLCTELERIGDYAKGISNILLRSGGLGMPKLLKDLQYMARKAVDMLHRAMDAFIREDMETARSIMREDELIDAFYEQIYFEAIDYVVENPANLERINYLLWVAHNLERVADRTTNVCERTIFVVTGRITELSIDEVESFSAEVR
jgi:phosphate transport system protein